MDLYKKNFYKYLRQIYLKAAMILFHRKNYILSIPFMVINVLYVKSQKDVLWTPRKANNYWIKDRQEKSPRIYLALRYILTRRALLLYWLFTGKNNFQGPMVFNETTFPSITTFIHVSGILPSEDNPSFRTTI